MKPIQKRRNEIMLIRQYLAEGGLLLVVGVIVFVALFAFVISQWCASSPTQQRGADWEREQVV